MKLFKKIVSIFLVMTAIASASPAQETEQQLRHPFVSGSFYPAEKNKLREMVEGFLAKATPTSSNKKMLALIAPHAGFVYSGQIAAYNYKLLEGKEFDTVILLGPYHKAHFPGASVWKDGNWSTPLGEVAIDTELANALYNESKLFQFTQDAHLAEHSLETQLPFLQTVLKKPFKIVPILISDPELKNCQYLAEAIAKHLPQDKRILIIASTDMSHYRDDTSTRQMDGETLKLLEKRDSFTLEKEIFRKNVELCGAAATLTVLELTKLLGETELHVLKYGNSADVSGDKNRVVGYSASVIYENVTKQNFSQTSPKSKEALNAEQRKTLLEISRKTLKSFITKGEIPEFQVKDEALKQDRAVFVTLRKNGQLRGCIGHILPVEPLHQAVRQMTIDSAVKDPRFPKVTADELKDIEIEISLLSPPRKVKSVHEIVMREHGVIVSRGPRRGVFLPKVADETMWTKEQFLNELCTQKAGLPEKCWEDENTELFVFTSYDFAER